MRFNVLGACSGLGQKQWGLDSTPDLIRHSGFLELLKQANVDFADLGNITPAANDIWPFLDRLKNKVSLHIETDQILFNLGGDHSIAIGTVCGTLEKYPDARLIWIDAHGDINTPNSSLTGNLHGMPLSAILGLFPTQLNLPKLNKENLILIGVRDLDPFEAELIKKLDITVISAKEINDNPTSALKNFTTWLKLKDSPLHVSFDIDAIDPNTAPATGLKVPHGLNKDFTRNLVQNIADTANVLAVDLVELNAFQAKNKIEIESSLDIFFMILQIFIDESKKINFGKNVTNWNSAI